jgi:hypothetical protein
LRLDFEKGPIHPSPLGPSILTTTAAEKENHLIDYEDHLASYESLFHAYRTWLDKYARVSLVLTANMEDHFVADIVEFEQTH